MNELKFETIWFDQRKYEEAESRLHQLTCVKKDPPPSSIVEQIVKARETIQQTLKGEPTPSGNISDPDVGKRLDSLEKENQHLKDVIKNIQSSLSKLEARVAKIEISKDKAPAVNAPKETEPATQPDNDDDDDDDDDVDLFGSDDDEEVEKLRQTRAAQYQAKKAKKPTVIAKSNIILDVKPWDDETDMAVLEQNVRSVSLDGLVWGKSKLVAVGYGIKKLQITCVVEDDKVGTDDLEEEITKFEDHVQSVDVVAFNKV